MSDEPQRRRADSGALCWIAARMSDLWDWIDKREIDKRIITCAILYGTIRVIEWAMAFASANGHGIMSGVEIGVVIAAVTAPYMALQAAAIGFLFTRRKE